MSAQMYGADVGELERLAEQFRRTADELDGEGTLLTGILGRVSWLGDIATEFLGEWTSVQIPRIGLSTEFLRAAANELQQQANEQREASNSSGGPIRGNEPSQCSPEDGSVEGDELSDLLFELGISASVAEALLSQLGALLTVADLKNSGLVKILDNLGSVLDAAGKVLSIVDVVVSFAEDYAEYSHLPQDERILHATMNSAVTVATTVGVEAASTAVVAALGTVIPVAGTGAGALVGRAIGGVVSAGLSAAIEYGNDRWDVVDTLVADPVVDWWRAAKKAAEPAKQVYDAVTEHAPDAVEWVADGVADAARTTRDMATGVWHRLGGGR